MDGQGGSFYRFLRGKYLIDLQTVKDISFNNVPVEYLAAQDRDSRS